MQHERNAGHVEVYIDDLAKAASRVLSTKQTVRPGQAAKYLPLFLEDNPTRRWLEEQGVRKARRYADSTDRIPREERARIKPHYAHVIPGRDAWLMGICATWVAYITEFGGAQDRGGEVR